MLAALDAGGVAIDVLADALDKAIRRQDLRARVTEGQLTLISPYHPQARFTVGNTMGRNKLIYTLAEAAFVVASGRSGGTFAGAIALHRREIEDCDLLGRAADAAPTEQLAVDWESAESAAKIGAAVEVASDDEVVAVRAADADARAVTQTAARDLFDVVWPSLASYLTVPRSERDVAEVFVIEVGQARAWLKRAAESGLVDTMKRPVRYQLTDTRRLSLLDSDD